jgi:hemolysin activation/secretion protein
MAIDMPPTMPPLQFDIDRYDEIKEHHQSYFITGNINGVDVRVYSLPHFSKKHTLALLNKSRSPSEFILNLNKAYNENGHLLIQVLYRQVDRTVYVYATQLKVDDIKGPQDIAKYFKALKGDKDLTVREIERLKAMADISSSRQGNDYTFSYEISADRSAANLVLNKVKRNIDRLQISGEIGNEGNRYVGNYLTKIGARYWLDSGSEFSAAYITGLQKPDQESEESSYRALLLNYNFPSTLGLYGAELLRSEYSRVIKETDNRGLLAECHKMMGAVCELTTSKPKTLYDISAETTSLTATGDQIAYSRSGQRLIFSQKISAISDQINDFQYGTILDESYGVAEAGAKYVVRSISPEEKYFGMLQLRISKGAGKGGTLSSEKSGAENINSHSGNFLLIKPSLNANFAIYKNLKLILLGEAQKANIQVPQMQQYTLGGMSQLAAFLPGVLSGDSGAHGRIELAISSPRKSGFRIVPSVFIEAGEVISENTTFQSNERRSASDFGARAIFIIGENFNIEILSAKILKSENISQEHINEYKIDFFAKARLTF